MVRVAKLIGASCRPDGPIGSVVNSDDHQIALFIGPSGDGLRLSNVPHRHVSDREIIHLKPRAITAHEADFEVSTLTRLTNLQWVHLCQNRFFHDRVDCWILNEAPRSQHTARCKAVSPDTALRICILFCFNLTANRYNVKKNDECEPRSHGLSYLTRGTEDAIP